MEALKYLIALQEVWEKVFRPNLKHGYSSEILDADVASEVIEQLASIFNEVLEDKSVELWTS
jgi:hypothetical protein